MRRRRVNGRPCPRRPHGRPGPERAEADARHGADEAAALVDDLRELLRAAARRGRSGSGSGCGCGLTTRAPRGPPPRAGRRPSSARPRSPVPCTPVRSTSCSSAVVLPHGRRREGARRARGGRGRPVVAGGRSDGGRRRRRRRRQRYGRARGHRQRWPRGRLDGVVDLSDRRLYRDDLALGREQLGDTTRRGRRQLAVRLVGRDRDERLILGDDVPLADEPLGDRPLGDAFAELRKNDVDEHGGMSL